MLLRLILGWLHVAMGVGQLVSWPAMPGILGACEAVPIAGLPWLAGR
jgi:hypothetical protein